MRERVRQTQMDKRLASRTRETYLCTWGCVHTHARVGRFVCVCVCFCAQRCVSMKWTKMLLMMRVSFFNLRKLHNQGCEADTARKFEKQHAEPGLHKPGF